jgi:hypothetical protein
MLLLGNLDMLSCSRVELMVAVLAQMVLLSNNMQPFLLLGLIFLDLTMLVTVFVVHHTKHLSSNWAIPVLTILRETRYLLFPAMLTLTE